MEIPKNRQPKDGEFPKYINNLDKIQKIPYLDKNSENS